jgi:hypothetical protein
MTGYNPATQSLSRERRLKNKFIVFTVAFVSSIGAVFVFGGYLLAIAYLRNSGHLLGSVALVLAGVGTVTGLLAAFVFSNKD